MHQPQPNQNQLPIASWITTGAVLFVLLVIMPRFGVWGLLIFLMVGIPIIRGVAHTLTSALEDYSQQRREREPVMSREESGSRTYRAPSAGYAYDNEKPKRRPEYVVGDDGELVEVDPGLDEDKPKRSESRYA